MTQNSCEESSKSPNIIIITRASAATSSSTSSACIKATERGGLGVAEGVGGVGGGRKHHATIGATAGGIGGQSC